MAKLAGWPSPQPAALSAGAWTSVWANMGSAADNPMHVEWFGMVAGLGFVLAFGYWCTDFLVVQRAMAAESMSAARRTPVIATIPKILIPGHRDRARHDRPGGQATRRRVPDAEPPTVAGDRKRHAKLPPPAGA